MVNEKIKLDINNANFVSDALQEEAIFSNLRKNPEFLQAFNTDLTKLFYQFIEDKQKLNEPVTLSLKGSVRSGKSTIAITIACKIAELNNKEFSVKNVCSDEYDFLSKVKDSEDNDVFVIDESKESVFGVGSMAKRMKIHDIQNIIAKKNISTLWITPRRFNDTNSDYGLQTIGRARNVKPNLGKLLLFNLMEGRGIFTPPFGFVILPIYKDVYSYGQKLSDEYEALKDAWIEKEKESDTNIMYEIQKKRAIELNENPKYVSLEKIKDKSVYAKSVLPSEFTKVEIDEIVRLSKLIAEGVIETDSPTPKKEETLKTLSSFS